MSFARPGSLKARFTKLMPTEKSNDFSESGARSRGIRGLPREPCWQECEILPPAKKRAAFLMNFL